MPSVRSINVQTLPWVLGSYLNLLPTRESADTCVENFRCSSALPPDVAWRWLVCNLLLPGLVVQESHRLGGEVSHLSRDPDQIPFRILQSLARRLWISGRCMAGLSEAISASEWAVHAAGQLAASQLR
jgi:hypothetical protein